MTTGFRAFSFPKNIARIFAQITGVSLGAVLPPDKLKFLDERLGPAIVALCKQAELAGKDPLTGLNNKGSLEEALRREIGLVERHAREHGSNGHCPVVAFIDINDFKKINDHISQDGGDQAIKFVAHKLLQSLYPTDFVARAGGDEFVVIMYNTTQELAEKKMRKIQQEIGKAFFTYDDGHNVHKAHLAISVGLKQLSEQDTDSSVLRSGSALMKGDKEATKEKEGFPQTGFVTNHPKVIEHSVRP